MNYRNNKIFYESLKKGLIKFKPEYLHIISLDTYLAKYRDRIDLLITGIVAKELQRPISFPIPISILNKLERVAIVEYPPAKVLSNLFGVDYSNIYSDSINYQYLKKELLSKYEKLSCS
jgi:hypothetical protein